MRRNLSLIATLVLLAVSIPVGLAGAGPHRAALAAAAPTIVSYQGQITAGGVTYTGTGYFKFAVVNSFVANNFWSNDGTPTGEPLAAVTLPVSQGLFNVLLGDTSLPGMTQPLPASAFTGADRSLRVWFSSDGKAFTPLSPDRRIAAVPFALQAQEAANADALDGFHAGNASDNVPLSNGAVNSHFNADMLDGYNAGNAGDNVPVSNGTLNANLNADLLDGAHAAALQVRVSGACTAGSTIRAINADGTVVCEAPGALPVFASRIVDPAGDSGWYTSVTIGSDGLPLISYRDNAGGDLRVAHCSDARCNSATITALDSAGDTGYYTSIATGADGLGVISYQDGTNADLKVAHCTNLLCTAATFATVDSAGEVGRFTAIAIGSDGLPLITYFDNASDTDPYPNPGLKVAHCLDAGCTTATTRKLDGGRRYAYYHSSIAIGVDGLPLISYYNDVIPSSLSVAHCANAACASAALYTLDASPAVNNSITIGSDGLGLISYFDMTNSRLKVAHCSNVACSSAIASLVDDPAAATVGRDSSIATGADGLGVISYYDESNDDLKVARCTNLLCSSASITTPDTGGDVGAYTSIAIGPDGMPVISYRDATDHGLKVVHCANPSCG